MEGILIIMVLRSQSVSDLAAVGITAGTTAGITAGIMVVGITAAVITAAGLVAGGMAAPVGTTERALLFRRSLALCSCEGT
jgi:hypothetical protein